ncbi:hypothetical protein K443DRAFT_15498 [Laccaria amethystina LaAM-08-1]|uniref:Uncharacterized protein n=1 Tax=Laccaria amethystina LaAM-08-1 TaxID=1095629 RepID=A0A0C9X0M8_9AGAR|nr:hypothetical protein K443DRAFT_15498 [Laccaria amethystina LaAM-08-1]
MAHCQREFLHAQWKILLDDEFMDAYENGIVIMCCDGIARCFYLRIFSYAADYPEKVLLTTIRNMGGRPCPRCLIPKGHIHLVGTECDKVQRKLSARTNDNVYQEKIREAQALIYGKNWAVESAPVQRILKPQSLVPTLNAFSERFPNFLFNFFEIFHVDFMHEVELGVWRALFLHLLRILDTVAGATDILDFRFCATPTFGRDSIRRFSSNISELKKLGARDYENLLQSLTAFFQSHTIPSF